MAPLCATEAAACEPRGRKKGTVYESGFSISVAKVKCQSALTFSPSVAACCYWLAIHGAPAQPAFLRSLLLTHKDVNQWDFSSGSSLFQAAVFLSTP